MGIGLMMQKTSLAGGFPEFTKVDD